MIIEIPDSLSGEERRRLLELIPMEYALKKCGSQREAASWLGIGEKTIRNWKKKHGKTSVKRTLVKEEFPEQLKEKLEEMKSLPAYRYASAYEKARIENRLKKMVLQTYQ